MQKYLTNSSNITIMIDACCEETMSASEATKKKDADAVTNADLMGKQFEVPYDFGILLAKNDELLFPTTRPAWCLVDDQAYDFFFSGCSVRVYRRSIDGASISIFAEA